MHRYVNDVIVPNVIGSGFSGWMADFGEYVPLGGVLHSANSSLYSSGGGAGGGGGARGNSSDTIGLQLHNAFPGLWAQTNAQVRARVDALAAAASAGSSGSDAAWARLLLESASLASGADLLCVLRFARRCCALLVG